jgi:hypothetical protein
MIGLEHAEYIGCEQDGASAVERAAVEASKSKRWVGVVDAPGDSFGIYAWGMAYHPDAKDVIRLGLLAWQVAS